MIEKYRSSQEPGAGDIRVGLLANVTDHAFELGEGQIGLIDANR